MRKGSSDVQESGKSGGPLVKYDALSTLLHITHEITTFFTICLPFKTQYHFTKVANLPMCLILCMGTC